MITLFSKEVIFCAKYLNFLKNFTCIAQVLRVVHH